MTEAQKRFVELEKQKEQVKKFYEDLKKAIEDVSKEVGVGGMFQDADGTVYQIVIPDGKFVTFEHISYIRTRRLNEKRGDLSIERAEAAGFAVPKK